VRTPRPSMQRIMAKGFWTGAPTIQVRSLKLFYYFLKKITDKTYRTKWRNKMLNGENVSLFCTSRFFK